MNAVSDFVLISLRYFDQVSFVCRDLAKLYRCLCCFIIFLMQWASYGKLVEVLQTVWGCTYSLQVVYHPAYGFNNNGIEQLLADPKQGENILDLILFCSHPYVISDISVIPGKSDHEAIYIAFNFNVGS